MSTLSNVTPQIGGFSLLYARLTSCVSSKKNTFGVSVRYVLEKNIYSANVDITIANRSLKVSKKDSR